MGAERRNYVMSVGLAMQREMAYRQKLERLTAERAGGSSSSSTSTSSRNYPLPFQVPKPTPNSGPPLPYFGPRPGQPLPPNYGPVPGPMLLARPQFPGPGPTHSTSGQKRKQPLQGESFFCNLCQIDCNTSFNLKMHFKGQKHKAKLNNTKRTKKKAARETGLSEWLQCELCDVWCSCELAFWQHLNGKNHNAMLQSSGNENEQS